MASDASRTVLVLLPDESVRIYTGPHLSAADVLANYPDCGLAAFGVGSKPAVPRESAFSISSRVQRRSSMPSGEHPRALTRPELRELQDGMTYCITPPASRPGSGTLLPCVESPSGSPACSSAAAASRGRRNAQSPAWAASSTCGDLQGAAPGALRRCAGDEGGACAMPALQHEAQGQLKVTWQQLRRTSGDFNPGHGTAAWQARSSHLRGNQRRSVELPRSASSAERGNPGARIPSHRTLSRLARSASEQAPLAGAVDNSNTSSSAGPQRLAAQADRGIVMPGLVKRRTSSNLQWTSSEMGEEQAPRFQYTSTPLRMSFRWPHRSRLASLGRRVSLDQLSGPSNIGGPASQDLSSLSARWGDLPLASGPGPRLGQDLHRSSSSTRADSGLDWLEGRATLGAQGDAASWGRGALSCRYTRPGGGGLGEGAVHPMWGDGLQHQSQRQEGMPTGQDFQTCASSQGPLQRRKSLASAERADAQPGIERAYVFNEGRLEKLVLEDDEAACKNPGSAAKPAGLWRAKWRTTLSRQLSANFLGLKIQKLGVQKSKS